MTAARWYIVVALEMVALVILCAVSWPFRKLAEGLHWLILRDLDGV